jgi:hypothetical protein
VLLMAEEKFVTQLEHSEMLRDTNNKVADALKTADCKVADALQKAENHADNQTEKLTVQTEKDVAAVTLAFDKLLAAQQKIIDTQTEQIKVLSDRLDRYLIFIIGLALSSMISVVLMLASLVLSGKVG